MAARLHMERVWKGSHAPSATCLWLGGTILMPAQPCLMLHFSMASSLFSTCQAWDPSALSMSAQQCWISALDRGPLAAEPAQGML